MEIKITKTTTPQTMPPEEKLGFGKLESAFVGGASDASYASAMQIPVVCASGPIVEKQHTRDERAYIPSLTERAKIHVATILNHL